MLAVPHRRAERIQLSVDVTDSRFGILNPSPRTEAREIILVAKILF